MIRAPIDRRISLALSISAFVVLAGLYTGLSVWQKSKNPTDRTIPSWSQMAEGLSDAVLGTEGYRKRNGKNIPFFESWLWTDSWATGSRLILGLAFGALGAVGLGLLMGCFRHVEAFFGPPLALLAQIPPTAALAVFFVMVGTDLEMYIVMIAFGMLPVMARTVYLAVRDVPDELLYKAYTLGASNLEVIWNIVVRHTLPKILDALRLQIGPAMVYLIAAEMVVGNEGFGIRIRLEWRKSDMSLVYPYLLFLAMSGFSMDFGLRKLRRWLCPWAE